MRWQASACNAYACPSPCIREPALSLRSGRKRERRRLTSARVSRWRSRAKPRSGGSFSGFRSPRSAASRSISRPIASRAWARRRAGGLGAAARGLALPRHGRSRAGSGSGWRRCWRGSCRWGCAPSACARRCSTTSASSTLEGLRRGGRFPARSARASCSRSPTPATCRGRCAAPRAAHHAQDARHRGGRFCRRQGAAAAARPRRAAGRLRFRARRLFPGRRRRRLRARAPVARRARRRSGAGAAVSPRSTAPATGWRCGSTTTHRRRRGRDRRRDGDGQARFPLGRREGPHPRGRHLSHHHHLRRADDAGRRHPLRRLAPDCWRCRRRSRSPARSRRSRRSSRCSGSLAYDIGTGSRVGTERALFMTLIVLGAVVLDRRALTMRNLAFAVLAVVALEPEAVMGVSFQLSFAAVAALIAVMEARLARRRTSGRARRRWLSRVAAGKLRRASVRDLSARRARRPRSWPTTSTTSAPMC